MILAGDIGGTKTLLAFYDEEGEKLVQRRWARYDSRAHETLERIVESFLAECPGRPAAACFGVPGPVSEGAVRTTNLPWRLTERGLSETLGIPRVKLVNDLVATAAALPHLGPEDLVMLHPGREQRERTVSLVVAPGTGLGHAAVCREGDRFTFLGSEAGHIEFAPRNAVEFDLLCHLQKKLGKRVSVERLLSGPGFLNIYSFFKETGFAPPSPVVEAEFETKGASAAIAEHGIRGSDPLSQRTIELFISVLGSHAGNMMLTFMSTGGVYLGGGIPPKILDKLIDGTIVVDYLAKGRLSPVVEATPLYVIKDDQSGLFGAANLASRLT